jgi:hypothetical protein
MTSRRKPTPGQAPAQKEQQVADAPLAHWERRKQVQDRVDLVDAIKDAQRTPTRRELPPASPAPVLLDHLRETPAGVREHELLERLERLKDDRSALDFAAAVKREQQDHARRHAQQQSEIEAQKLANEEHERREEKRLDLEQSKREHTSKQNSKNAQGPRKGRKLMLDEETSLDEVVKKLALDMERRHMSSGQLWMGPLRARLRELGCEPLVDIAAEAPRDRRQATLAASIEFTVPLDGTRHAIRRDRFDNMVSAARNRKAHT